MKKLIAIFLFICAFSAVQAQSADTTLNAYTGTYKFPGGSFVTSAEITVADNVLTVSSDKGSSSLERKGRDTFALTAYDGILYFFRNKEGKVAKVKVELQDISFEGTKDGATAWIQRNNLNITRRQLQVK